jgi:hypothetical protein
MKTSIGNDPNQRVSQAIRKRMKQSLLVACLVGFGCLVCCGFGAADPCNSPKRMIGGGTVDLQPLFEWWSNQKEGKRPLPKWKHVRGSIVRETALGWIITGEAEGESQMRFLVKNPPRERLQRFEDLHRQLPLYERQRADLNEYLQRPLRTPYYETYAFDSPLPPINWRDQQAALARLDEIERTIAAIHQEIGNFEDEHGNFRLDGFALRLHERYDGLPVFDHGYSISMP